MPANRYLWVFVLFHVLLWTLMPTFFHPNAPLDIIESSNWGYAWQWGYFKHPPLSAWMVELVMTVTGSQMWSLFLLSQLCILATFISVYHLGKEWMIKEHAITAALLIEGIYYMNYTSPEFNPNVLLIPLWVMCISAFWFALEHGKTRYWLLLGVLMGLAILSKYYALFLALAMALYALKHLPCAKWATSGPWFAAGIACLILVPHTEWALTHNFPTLKYSSARSDADMGWLAHILYPLKFSVAQLGAVSGTIILFLFIKGKWKRENETISTFLLWMCFLPFLLTVLLSAIFGLKLKSMWGTPLWGIFTLFLVYHFPPKATLKRAVIGAYALLILGLSVYTIELYAKPYLKDKVGRAHFPGDKVAEIVTEKWRENMNTSLPIVIGSDWVGGNVRFYSPDKPAVFVEYDEAKVPWLSHEQAIQQGAMLVWNAGRDIPPYIAVLLPESEQLDNVEIPYRTKADITPLTLGMAILWPQAVRDGTPLVFKQQP